MESSSGEQIEEFIRNGKADQAISIIHKKLKHVTKPEEISLLTLYLGKSYRSLGLITEAKLILSNLLTQLPQSSLLYDEVLYELGLIMLSNHEYDEIPRILDILKIHVNQENNHENPKLQAQYHELMGLYYLTSPQNDNLGKLHLNKAAFYRQQLGDLEYVSYIYSRLAQFLIEQGSIIEALTYSTLSIENYPKKESKGFYALILITHARALLYNNMTQQAIITLRQASKLIYTGIPNSEPLALLLLTSIELTLQQGLVKESLIYSELVYPELHEINQPNLSAIMYYNLILIYINLQEDQLAHKIFLETKSFLKDLVTQEKYVYLLLHVFKSIYESNVHHTPTGMMILDFITNYFQETSLSFLQDDMSTQFIVTLKDLLMKNYSTEKFAYLEQICQNGFPVNALFIKTYLIVVLIEEYFYFYHLTQDKLILEKIQKYIPQLVELSHITGSLIFEIYAKQFSELLTYFQQSDSNKKLSSSLDHQILRLKHFISQFT